ncbi:MAG TPA: N-acetyltransferase [Actinospica sp.]|nr:N-acetyltransferase [Actinospica sp.]
MDEAEIESGVVRARRPAYIRQARLADLTALHDVDEAVFGELAYPLFVLRQFVDVHQRHFLVVDADPPLLGYVLAAYAARAEQAWLLGLGVHPDARTYGYGRALMHRCLDRLRSDGATSVRLTVKPDNAAAIHLYESTGFKKTGYIPHYYGDGEGRYEMVASLTDRQTMSVGAAS